MTYQTCFSFFMLFSAQFSASEVVKALKNEEEDESASAEKKLMMASQGDNFVLNELIREYLEWNGCVNAADVMVCEGLLYRVTRA